MTIEVERMGEELGDEKDDQNILHEKSLSKIRLIRKRDKNVS